MNSIQEIEDVKIEDLIYEIRGKQVMLDSDLGFLYKCKNGTKTINQSVVRNKDKFPDDFCFQLTREEYNSILKSQIGTSSFKNHGGVRKLPFAFTEEGVAMLATTIHTKIANEISIRIMKGFVAMKKFISSNLLEQKIINNMVLEHNNDIKLLKEAFAKFDNISNEIFYEGQIYDAYSLLLDILNSSNKSIIIIDNFANKKLFDLLSKTNKKVTVYSKNIDNELIKKYRKQYDNVTLIYNDSYHDRFIIIDEKILYHCGSSFKDLGSKCFCISRIDNQEMIKNLLLNIRYN